MNQHHEEPIEEDTAKTSVISNNTPVQVGVVIAIVSGIIAFTWWASNMSAKMSQVLENQMGMIATQNGMT
jgi:predicted negative regulator of RcsB-dependent stress response